MITKICIACFFGFLKKIGYGNISFMKKEDRSQIGSLGCSIPWLDDYLGRGVSRFKEWVPIVVMIGPAFLSVEDRREPELSACDGSSSNRYGRRADAILLFDRGMSCQQVSSVLFIGDDMVHQWYCYWIEGGFDGLISFGFGGSDGFLSREQSDCLYGWACQTLPRSIREVGPFIRAEFALITRAVLG